ncbi:MAG TPA: DNA translocase FtsK 4TM domain-containing protein [Acidimicrobiia bacterium]
MPTATKRRPAAKSKSRSRSRSRAKRPARQPLFTGTREALSEQLSAHSSDAAAIAAAVAGVLVALGVYTTAAGPLGHALNVGLGAALGRGRFFVPLACFAATAALLIRRSDEPSERHGLRVGLGATLVVVSVTGLWHLAAGQPTSQNGLKAIEHAGGVLGALTGSSIAALAGVVGASIILAALTALGLLLVTGLTFRTIVPAVATAVRWVVVETRSLFDLSQGDEELDDDELDLAAEEAAELDAPEPEAAPAPRARKTVLYDVMTEDSYFAPDEIDLAPDEAAEAGAADEEYEEEEYEEDEEGEYEEYEDDEDGEYEEVADDDTDADAEDAEAAEAGQGALDLGPGYKRTDWKLPAASLLKRGSGKQVDERLIDAGGEVLEATLQEFGVDARLIGRAIGPTVSRYELELAPGVKVNKVTNLAKEIAYAMASHDVRILAPIPGRSAIGVEVPNKVRPIITLGDILASEEAHAATHPLQVGLGRDIAGRSVMANLSTFPHVLIAGQTGAGKSSCINSIVTTLLMRATPDQVRLILVDPKRVELGQYNNVPHLLTEVVVNPKKAANALDWAVREMEMRYDLLAEVGVRDIAGYNALWDRGDLPTADNPDPMGGKAYERLPFIVIVVDELADLMMVAARDVEASIARLAQMARAVGLHLVIATQRPSVDVITGVIKANIPSRLAFAVSSLTDSRVILDQPGAEKLVGKGDMLLLSASSSRTERIQGAWVDEDCVRKVVAHWRRQTITPSYVEGVQGEENTGGGFFDDDEGDELLEQAMELVVRGRLGSTSMLQRKLRVGFARAGRIMDLLERRGVVGPSEGSKPRSVLMTVEELDEIQGE